MKLRIRAPFYRARRGLLIGSIIFLFFLSAVPAWASTDWKQITASAPRPRWGAASTYDPTNDAVFVFGGCADPNGATSNPCATSQTYNDTWEYSFFNQTWSHYFPTRQPSQRIGASMAYDPYSGHIILFGGISGGSPGTLNSETWSWNGSDWSQLSPSRHPSARVWAGMATEGSSGSTNRPLLFGGCIKVNSSNKCDPDFTYLDGQTWRWTGTDWTMLANNFSSCTGSSGGPLPRYATAFTTDNSRDVVMFGGKGKDCHGDSTPQIMDELWIWSDSAGSWSQVTKTPLNWPAVRAGAAFGLVNNGLGLNQTLLYGGGDSDTNPFNDSWFFNEYQSVWTQCLAQTGCAHSPSNGRSLMAYGADGARMAIFGGMKSDGASSYGDTWVYG